MAFYYILLISSIFIGSYRYSLQSKNIKILLLLLVITLLSEIIAHFFAKRFHNNLFVYHIFNPIQFILVLIMFNLELKKKWIYYLIPLGLLFTLVNSFMWQHYSINLNSNFLNLESLFFIFLSLTYIKTLTQTFNAKDKFIEFPLFIVSLGFFLFSLISVLTFGMYNYIESINENERLLSFLTILRLSSNYILYVCFLLAFLTKQKQLT